MENAAQPLLSERQAEISELIVGGKSTPEIGLALGLSARTVETHIAAIFTKFGVRSRVELVTTLLGGGRDAASADRSVARPVKTNLPLASSELIGRESAIADVVDLLGSRRLVTVTGTGGIGKTRTALAVGDALLADTKAGYGSLN